MFVYVCIYIYIYIYIYIFIYLFIDLFIYLYNKFCLLMIKHAFMTLSEDQGLKL